MRGWTQVARCVGPLSLPPHPLACGRLFATHLWSSVCDSLVAWLVAISLQVACGHLCLTDWPGCSPTVAIGLLLVSLVAICLHFTYDHLSTFHLWPSVCSLLVAICLELCLWTLSSATVVAICLPGICLKVGYVLGQWPSVCCSLVAICL